MTKVVVSLTDQMLYAYDGDELIAVSTISSGKDSHPTPTGIFPIMQKARFHRSNQYNDAPMPYMQRLDNYGIALHAGDLPGYPASHGCIRLPKKFAAKLFAATEIGTEVMVGRYGSSRPAHNDVDHPAPVSWTNTSSRSASRVVTSSIVYPCDCTFARTCPHHGVAVIGDLQNARVDDFGFDETLFHQGRQGRYRR